MARTGKARPRTEGSRRSPGSGTGRARGPRGGRREGRHGSDALRLPGACRPGCRRRAAWIGARRRDSRSGSPSIGVAGPACRHGRPLSRGSCTHGGDRRSRAIFAGNPVPWARPGEGLPPGGGRPSRDGSASQAHRARPGRALPSSCGGAAGDAGMSSRCDRPDFRGITAFAGLQDTVSPRGRNRTARTGWHDARQHARQNDRGRDIRRAIRSAPRGGHRGRRQALRTGPAQCGGGPYPEAADADRPALRARHAAGHARAAGAGGSGARHRRQCRQPHAL